MHPFSANYFIVWKQLVTSQPIILWLQPNTSVTQQIYTVGNIYERLCNDIQHSPLFLRSYVPYIYRDERGFRD